MGPIPRENHSNDRNENEDYEEDGWYVGYEVQMEGLGVVNVYEEAESDSDGYVGPGDDSDEENAAVRRAGYVTVPSIIDSDDEPENESQVQSIDRANSSALPSNSFSSNISAPVRKAFEKALNSAEQVHLSEKDFPIHSKPSDIPLTNDKVEEIKNAISGLMIKPPEWVSKDTDKKIFDSAKKRPSPEFNVANCDRSARGIWLVKVPKYLSEIWQQNEGAEIGSLITGSQVVFRSNPTIQNNEKSDVKKVVVQSSTSKYAPPEDLKPLGKKNAVAPQIPSEHRFIIKDLDNQTMAVLVEDKTHLEDEAHLRTGKLTVEGRIVKRAECQPPATTDYMKMKMSQIEKYSQPKHTVKQMDKAEVKFKPTAVHQENLAKEKIKKDTNRAVRVDRDILMKEIFQAFEKHQYYRLADLAKLTNQPMTHVKDILTSIANYSTTPPHKNMWELKPEFRSYDSNMKTEDDE
ncbi:General transcription factor IIF subunit 2 [Aphelenchoides besseyi]|nr:General transcription factor IIF subunit 2 [Aphelenchoides besseyi]KAI6199825.1 General transcription factor IIF subunit 2 [Aphelenchoides besseyi]